MKFTKLRKTKTYGNYQNISLEAEFDETEKVEWVNDVIDRKIDELISLHRQELEAKANYNNKKYNIDSLERECKALEERIRKYHAFMEKHGIELREELPF